MSTNQTHHPPIPARRPPRPGDRVRVVNTDRRDPLYGLNGVVEHVAVPGIVIVSFDGPIAGHAAIHTDYLERIDR